MTDNEIIKALDGKTKSLCETCDLKKDNCSHCVFGLARAALGLINRQKAEIERLKNHIQEAIDLAKQLPEMVALTKAEAYKEFWNELKTYSRKMRVNDFRGSAWDRVIFVKDGDNFLKEIVGADE